jgi:hypothetical protein
MTDVRFPRTADRETRLPVRGQLPSAVDPAGNKMGDRAALMSSSRIIARMACVRLILIAEYLLVMVAARNAGARLVANVLAIEGADKNPTAGKVPAKRSPRKRPEPKGKGAPET